MNESGLEEVIRNRDWDTMNQFHEKLSGYLRYYLFKEFKGALTGQYVMQQLIPGIDRYIGCWTNERSTSEVDFVIQDQGVVIPVEVKSGENLRSKSFKPFCEKYKPVKAIRASMAPY